MLTLILRKIPFFFLASCYIGGILLYELLPLTVNLCVVLFASSLAAMLIIVFRNYPLQVNQILAAFVVFLGFSLTAMHSQQAQAIAALQGSRITCTMQVVDPQYRQHAAYRSYLVRGCKLPGKYIVRDYRQTEAVSAGQLIYLQAAELKRFRSSALPGEFNYARYLQNQKIYGYFTSGFILADQEKLSIQSLFYRWKTAVLKRFASLRWNEKQQGFVQAITLGDRSLLDENLSDAFRQTGMSHVLAVSGLHVGIVYMFLLRLFFMLKSNRNKSLLIILCLWAYALLVGMPVSVTRAVFMFSLMESGRLFRQDNSVYNAIFASAFVLLLIHPQQLYHVGFQLSYAAVLSIVFFFPRIKAFFPQGNFVVNKLSDLFSLAVSAQLGTFPFVLYYFNSFPLYFLLGNIFFVPLVMVLVVGGVLLIPCCFYAPLANLLLLLINPLTDLVFLGTQQVASWPYAQISDLYINANQLLLLLSGIATWVCLLRTRRLISVSFMLFALLYVETQQLIHNRHQDTLFFPVTKRNYEAVFVIPPAKQSACLYYRGEDFCLLSYRRFLKKYHIKQEDMQVQQLEENIKLRFYRQEETIYTF